jgi:hypothetical protein
MSAGENEIERPMKILSAVGLGILLLLMEPVWAAAGAPGDQVRQTADKLLAILKDPQLQPWARSLPTSMS